MTPSMCPSVRALAAFDLLGQSARPLAGGQGRAWSVGSLVLKPVDDVRFVHAIDRARTVVAERNSHVRARALGQAIAAPLAPRRRIVLHERGRVLILEHKDIDWIAAEGDYVRVHAAGKGYLVRNTMAATEARLDPALFARIHRSTIVRIDAVREVRSEGDRHWLVVLRDRTKLRMSRLYRSRLPL